MEDLMTPLDIYNKEFNKTFSVWSYNVDEVDDFLDLVGEAYEYIYLENEELNKELTELKERLRDYKEREETLSKTIDTVKTTADNQQQNAKQEAEAIIRNAQSKAELIIEKAEVQAEKVLKEADKQIAEKRREYKNLIEHEQLFTIKFKTLLNTYLTMLEDKEDMDDLKEEFNEEFEANLKEDLDEDDLQTLKFSQEEVATIEEA